jgi:hypothetical protein
MVGATATVAGGTGEQALFLTTMNTSVRFWMAALPVLLTGCVGTGPNTQQGAVTGGALGALAGAVIGNNSRGGDALAGALIGGAAGAVAGGTIGNSIDNQQGTVYGAERERVPTYVRQPMAPPAAPVPDVVTPSPSPNALWIPGYWNFTGSGYVWTAGHWEIPPAGASSYVAAHWENRAGALAFVPAYWR